MLIIEILLIGILLSLISPINLLEAIGNKETRKTKLSIRKSAPKIENIDVESGSVVLIANDSKKVDCIVDLSDYDGNLDINSVNAEFFDVANSFYGEIDDDNDHYTNSSCYINYSYGTIYEARAHCTFDVWYYANQGQWNCTAYVEDQSGYNDENSGDTIIESLLSIGLPDFINYGEVNATEVSDEQIANVTNYGNVELNLSLQGYAISEGDDLAMNCTLGSIGTIPIEYEKYNLSTSTPGVLNLGEADSFYENLSSSEIVKEFNLNYRKNDTENEAINSTYWRIYVPIGVAGTCEGNIIFGARQENV